MIDMNAPAFAQNPAFAEEQCRFHMEPPGYNPLADLPSVTLVEGVNGITIEPITVISSPPGAGKSISVLADMVAQTRRDVERYPNSARAHTSLAFALLNNGEVDAASEEFAAALSLDPSHYLARGGKARICMLLGRLDEAKRLYDALREARPHDPNPLMGLAEIAMRRGAYEDAVDLWQAIGALAPQAAYPHFGRGLALLLLGCHHEAIGQFRIATRRDVRSAAFHHGLGVAYALIGDETRAIRAFKAALTLAPHMPEAVQGLAAVLLRQGRFEAVEVLLKDHLTTRPSDYDAHEVLAWAYMQQGKHRAAKSEFYQTLQVIPKGGLDIGDHRARLSNNLGVCYVLLHDYDEARRLFETSIGARPDGLPAPYYNLARLHCEANRFDDAHAVLADCGARFPEDQGTRVLVAWCFQAQEQYDDAINELYRIITAQGAPTVAYVMLASLLTDAKQEPDAALAILDEACRRFSEDPDVANSCAYTHLMRGDIAAARMALAAVPEHVSGTTEIVLTATRGLLRLWEGDIESGAQGYIQAESIARQQGVSWMETIVQKRHLEVARAYLRIGRVEAARREVKKGLLIPTGSAIFHRDLVSLGEKLHDMPIPVKD